MRHQTVGFYTEETRSGSESFGPGVSQWWNWLYKIMQADLVFRVSNAKFDDRGKKYALRDAVIRLEQRAGFDFNATLWLRPLQKWTSIYTDSGKNLDHSKSTLWCKIVYHVTNGRWSRFYSGIFEPIHRIKGIRLILSSSDLTLHGLFVSKIWENSSDSKVQAKILQCVIQNLEFAQG